MYLHDLYQPLAVTEDAGWQALLDRFAFWRAPGARLDDEHQDIAFHILLHEGELAQELPAHAAAADFDAVPIPPAFFDDAQAAAMITDWARMHAGNYGPGVTTKMGLYVIRAGGVLGFHVDGPVFLKGVRADLSQPRLQRGLVEVQASHRTVLPLRFNTDDRFMVCGKRVPLARRSLFEFSNVLPHAYTNLGREHAVLLVTTYLEEALLPRDYDYAALLPARASA
jgi:hypothetical protein